MATSPLISVDDLRRTLTETTVLDVRYRVDGAHGLPEFTRGHIPSAAYVDLDSALAAPPSTPVDARGRHPLPEPASFVASMQAAGVSRGRPVVVYDDWQGRAAARAWWLLRYYGHEDVRVLDGGWAAWVAAWGAVEEGAPHDHAQGDFQGRPGTMPVATAEQASAADVLVDARAPERFRGEVEPLDPVAGHIPGAVNVDTSRNLDPDGTFRPAAALRALYEGVGAGPDVRIVAYCGSGVTAAHDVLAMEVSGLRAALYAPSWSGWVADPDRPVAASPD